MRKGTGGFKNIKLGKNVYRQIKRKGPPPPIPNKYRKFEKEIPAHQPLKPTTDSAE